MNQVLQLQIDIFCTDICESVRSWNVDEIVNNPLNREHINNLICLYDVNGNKIT